MSTRADLRALVLANIGGRTDRDTVINNAFDYALKHAIAFHAFQDARAEADLDVEADDLYAELNTERRIREIRLLDGTSSHPIVLKSKQWIVSRWPSIEDLSAGKPRFAYKEGGKLYFSVPIDDDYTIRVTYATPSSFADDDAENPIPVLEEYLVAYGTHAACMSCQMFEAAQNWRFKWQELLTTAKELDMQDIVEHVSDAVSPGDVSYINPWEDPFYGFDIEG